MNTFFISDTHFGHHNIIRYCNRPFRDVTDMDETMIRNWNAVVGPGDRVFHLGDFSNHRNPERLRGLFHRLNGNIELIIGNHDDENEAIFDLPWASEPQRLREVVVDHTRLVLCHYPLRSWNKIAKGAVHLFGHLHGRLPGTVQSIDVGVDVFGFRPVELSEIRRRLKRNPPLPPLPPVGQI